MDIFNLITLMGGLAFFLFGMNIMSGSLTKLAGGKLEQSLRRITSNKFASLLMGAVITIAIQSSSALTVMLVGLVNSGIMDFSQTLPVIMGGNIGTTLTAWILSLAGISSDNILLRLMKPENFSLLFALVGILMVMLSKRQRLHDIGTIFVGFAVLMYGMKLMSDSVAPLADSPEFTKILTAFSAPLIGVLVGTVFTGIIQSSAATIGILQALSLTGSVTYGMAIPLIMGLNIGTCATSLISSIGVSRKAKRVAVVHISIKIIGTILCLFIFYGLNALLHFAFLDASINVVGIALCHSIFNIFTTIVLLPFLKLLTRMTERLVPDKNTEADLGIVLDDRLLRVSSMAIAESTNEMNKMAVLAKDSLFASLSLLDNYNSEAYEYIQNSESKLDRYEDSLGSYLIKIAYHELTDVESQTVSKHLHTINNLERLGDHAVNILESAQELNEKELVFSDNGKADLDLLMMALREIVTHTVNAYTTNDLTLARKIEAYEDVFDELILEVKARHIDRLKNGVCTIELGFIFQDLLNNFERVSDHCSNIAVYMLQVPGADISTHTMVDELKQEESFHEDFDDYLHKYNIPEDTEDF